tara:strand:- start:27252 stop:27875 length:624 start_codon:yes stop_codon:yes gene_type:complete
MEEPEALHILHANEAFAKLDAAIAINADAFENGHTRANALLKRIPVDKPFIGVELGTYRAELAELLLKHRPLLELYMIDTWRIDVSLGGNDPTPLLSEEHYAEIFMDAARRIAPYLDRAHIIKTTTNQAVNLFGEGFFDFAFIDADHAYHAVFDDIRLWLPKIQSSGFISGHDYWSWSGTRSAVKFFFEGHIETDAGDTWFVDLSKR